MLHPSYLELINTINKTGDPDEEEIVNSRYSVVIATAKRARQLIGGDESLVPGTKKKPLSIAVDEVASGKVTIVREEPEQEDGEKDGLEAENIEAEIAAGEEPSGEASEEGAFGEKADDASRESAESAYGEEASDMEE